MTFGGMMHPSTGSIDILFIAVTAGAVYLLWNASGKSRGLLAVVTGWIVLQSAAALSEFYRVTDTIPPRFIVLVGPPLLVTILLFMTKRGRSYVDRFTAEGILAVHTSRIGIEIVLFLLAGREFVPQMMTWEGRNFDVLTGLTAPLMIVFVLRKRILPNISLLIWNIAGLLLLCNVVVHGILSAPSPFQQFSFERPNLLPLYFPYILLPSLLVPMMLFAHLTAIRSWFRRT